MKFYKAKEPGHCGPCSFINLLGIKGSLKLERKLMGAGRAKPFRNSDWTSFMIWADLYKKNFNVYLTTTKFHKEKYDKLERRFDEFEDLSNGEFEGLKKNAERRYKRLLRKYKSKINIIKDPLRKLDELLKEGRKAVLSTNTSLIEGSRGLPHFFVVYKKEGKYYQIMDSAFGLTKMSRAQLEKGIEINKKIGRPPVLIVRSD